MKFLSIQKIPFLFSILCIALISLMVFQVNWLLTSHKLIEEQFDQKVNMAIGSTFAELNSKAVIPSDVNDLQICEDGINMYFSLEDLGFNEEAKSELEETLGDYMSCYGIEQKYKVEFFTDSAPKCKDAICCSLGTLKSYNDTETTLGISFGEKSEYLFDQLLPMILSSILIFLLIATVSFIILWSLVKQKRLTENNIDFFNNTAHEFKTPLTNISLALKLLGNKHEFIREEKYAQIIHAENTKLSSQIERVLYLSRMESNEYVLKKEPIDLKELITDVADNFQLMLEEKSGELFFELPAKEITISGDYYHLSNVVNNLIDNAIKYCDEKPHIILTLIEEKNLVKLNIKDNGIGISPQDQDHIFEKFQRVNTGNIRIAKGFGLGLAYVKKVIELHKGSINVQSDLNKGSNFQLLIPTIK